MATKQAQGLPLIDYFYDLAGRQIEIKKGGVTDLSYAYDALGQLTSETQSLGTHMPEA